MRPAAPRDAERCLVAILQALHSRRSDLREARSEYIIELTIFFCISREE